MPPIRGACRRARFWIDAIADGCHLPLGVCYGVIGIFAPLRLLAAIGGTPLYWLDGRRG